MRIIIKNSKKLVTTICQTEYTVYSTYDGLPELGRYVWLLQPSCVRLLTSMSAGGMAKMVVPSGLIGVMQSSSNFDKMILMLNIPKQSLQKRSADRAKLSRCFRFKAVDIFLARLTFSLHAFRLNYFFKNILKIESRKEKSATFLITHMYINFQIE